MGVKAVLSETVFEAILRFLWLLQHHMTISARSASNYLDSPLFAFATLDCRRLAASPLITIYLHSILQSRTCGYNHELFPVVFINVEISTFHFLTLWKCADIQPSFKQKQGFSRVLPGFSLYFHKAVFAHALKPLVHKGLRWWLDIISTFSWLLPAGTERGEAAGAECGETLLCPTALFI